MKLFKTGPMTSSGWVRLVLISYVIDNIPFQCCHVIQQHREIRDDYNKLHLKLVFSWWTNRRAKTNLGFKNNSRGQRIHMLLYRVNNGQLLHSSFMAFSQASMKIGRWLTRHTIPRFAIRLCATRIIKIVLLWLILGVVHRGIRVTRCAISWNNKNKQ